MKNIRTYESQAPGSGRLKMLRRGLLLLWAASFVLLGALFAGPAQAEEFGILSETYAYPDGVRLNTDSKLEWYFNTKTEEDTVDKPYLFPGRRR